MRLLKNLYSWWKRKRARNKAIQRIEAKIRAEEYLQKIEEAYLGLANLEQANLEVANLQQAFLVWAENLTPNQIKSACFWSEAIYKGEWYWEKKTKTWVAENEQARQDNENYIEELKKDKASDPEYKPDCSIWEERE